MFTDSKFLRDTDWVMKTFQEGYREQQVLLTAADVLEPYVLQKVSASGPPGLIKSIS